MSSFLEKRIAASIAQKAEVGLNPLPAAQSIEGSMGDIASRLEQQLKSAEDYELETLPRDTILRFLIEKKMDEPFVFKTAKCRGAAYVQAMRQVLARARAKALRTKTPLMEFKVFELDIKTEENFDQVTLVRSRRMTATEESVYDELLAQFTKPLVVRK